MNALNYSVGAIALGFFVTVANATVSSSQRAGMCVGYILISTSIYNVPAKDWDQKTLQAFFKNHSTFEKINPIIQRCLQGSEDLNRQNFCISKLPSQKDQEFYRGVLQGGVGADKDHAKGGLGVLKINSSLICSGA